MCLTRRRIPPGSSRRTAPSANEMEKFRPRSRGPSHLARFTKMDLTGAGKTPKRALAEIAPPRGRSTSSPRPPGGDRPPARRDAGPEKEAVAMSPERQTGNLAREIVAPPRVRRVVVKLGSGTVTHPEKGLREPTIRALAAQLSSAWSESGVSSSWSPPGDRRGEEEAGDGGAPPDGGAQAGRRRRRADVPHAGLRTGVREARAPRGAAAPHPRGFRGPGAIRQCEEHASRAPRPGIVPIVNENDTVATEEIRLEGGEGGRTTTWRRW